jgi:hypothetical protein
MLSRLSTYFYQRPRLVLFLFLAPPLLYMLVVYLGSLFALLINSFYYIDDFSGIVIREFTLRTYAQIFSPANREIFTRTASIFGMLALFAAFIPSVGTALVTLPMIVLLVLSGDVWQPIFLTIWSVLAIGLVDNILKPLLIKNGVRLNGVVIFIALVGGMFVFGAIGLIIGPLAVTTFLSMVRFMYREYVERPQPTVVTSVTAELVACTGPAKEATENPHKQKEGPESPSLQTT